MKYLVALSVLFFTVENVQGQRCEKKIDPFTNESVSTFEWRPSGMRTIFFESRNGVNIMEFRTAELIAVEYTVPKGSEVLLKLENGEVIELKTLNDSKSTVASMTMSESNNLVYSTYFLKMEVAPEHLQKMASFKISDLRYPDLHGGSRSLSDKELKNKWQRLIIDGSKCMLGIK